MKGIVFLSGLISGLLTSGIILPASSQVTSDGTTNTTVRASGNNFDILNGIQKGNNLFHSFQEFSIPTGSSATFNNSTDIVNIINRVTGGNISNIDGLIKANGNANLFLINPAGIVFGENARLNIGGSFLGTTAESILFEDGFEFSAMNPQNEPLLTVSVPLGLQMGNNPGKIEVQGNGHQIIWDNASLSFIRDARPLGLQVPSGKTLALIGGDISLQGGNLTAEGGRIELGSVLESAKVELIPTSDGFTTGYDGVSQFGDINFSSATSVEVSGEGAGNLQFQGRKISLVEESLIIADTLGKENGGLFSVKASESLEIIGGGTLNIFTGFITGVEVDGTGNAGNTNIETPQLSLMMLGSLISSATVGSGNAGNINLKVDNLAVRNGSYIQTATYADGNSGDFNLVAAKSVEVGVFSDNDFGSLRSFSNDGSSGNAGNLSITTPQLNLAKGFIFANTFGSGNAGNLNLTVDNLNIRGDGSQIGTGTFADGNGGNLTVSAANSVEITGAVAEDRFFSTGLFASAEFGSSGNAGNLNINTSKLSLEQGGVISVNTLGSGHAGNINLTVDNLNIRGYGSQIGTVTFADGNGGNLTINAANSVEITGVVAEDIFFIAGLFAYAEFGSSGDAGNLNINTSKLSLEQGGVISANTFGSGNAGNMKLTVDNLAIKDDSQISTGTFADGHGGDLTLIAADSVETAGFNSGLFSDAGSGSTGDAGDLKIDSRQLNIRDGAKIAVSNLGSGNAGDLHVNADAILIENQAALEANVFAGDKGNINLNSNFIQLRRNGRISTNATGTANGGNIDINSPVIAGFEDSDIRANAVEGNGGNIDITTQGLFGLKFREQPTDNSDITASSEFGINGTVQINNVGIEPSSGLVELPELVNTDVVIASSCVARSNNQDSTFYITGKPGFPYRPGEAVPSDYSMFEVRALSDDTSLKTSASPKKGGSILEATGIYPLENGELVIGRECEK